MMQNEAWRPVLGYEGIYEVSDMGQVRSLNRIDASGHRRRGRELSQSLTHNGYPRVTLTKLGHEKSRKVHQLVLEAFRGPCPPGMEGCHNNGKPIDCRLSNLRWDTKKSNATDRVRHGTMYRGEQHHAARLREDDIQRIFVRRKNGHTPKQIAVDLGVSRNLIYDILARKKWKHVKVPA